jgi:predicted ATPase/Tfp pilus assembly protein PilF
VTNQQRGNYDVFLSYHAGDSITVEALARRLQEVGLQPWLDLWNLPVGQEWQQLVEHALVSCNACVVCIGSHGLGRWQELEMRVALEQSVRSQGTYRVMAVLLPGADRNCVPPFLNLSTWVEFRQGMDDDTSLRRLIQGLRAPSFEVAPDLGAARAEIDSTKLSTKLIGRDAEVDQGLQLLHQPEIRLVTLTGPGGVGKTRLALTLSARLHDVASDGSVLVDLSVVADPGLVVAAIAQTLRVEEQLGEGLESRVRTYLQERDVLLVLDNFEQVIGARTFVATLLDAAPRLKILVTSRVRLGLAAEHELIVPPLETPNPRNLPPIDMLAQTPAITLFVQRAWEADRTFQLSAANAQSIAEICVCLDGLPLAIELAAARCKLFSPQALLSQLERSLGLLVDRQGQLPERQRTLWNTVDWSYQLLETRLRRVFSSLAVFVGSCTIEAIQETLRPLGPLLATTQIIDDVETLLDHSLLRRTEASDSQTRIVMLETVRTFAYEQFAADAEADAIRERHARYYLQLAEAENREHGRPAWGKRIDQDLDNLRAAMDWALKRRQVELGVRLGAALWRYWYARGYRIEGRQRLEQIIDVLGNAERSVDDERCYAELLKGVGVLADEQGDQEQAIVLFEESLRRFHILGDVQGAARVLTNLGVVWLDRGDYEQAQDLFEESLRLCRTINDQMTLALNLGNLGIVAQELGNLEWAQVLYEENLAVARQLGIISYMVTPLNNLGLSAYALGDTSRALALFEESLALCREIDDRQGVAHSLANLGWAILRQQKLDRASDRFVEALRTFQLLDDPRGIAECLEGIGGIGAASGNTEKAARFWGAAAQLREDRAIPLPPDEQLRLDTLLGQVQPLVPPEIWNNSWIAGRILLLDRAIDEALVWATTIAEA